MKTQKSVYHAIFESHLRVLHWLGTNSSSVKRPLILQKKSAFFFFFVNRNARAGPLIKNLKNLKFCDKVALENCLLLSKSLHKTFPKIFFDRIMLSFEPHTCYMESCPLPPGRWGHNFIGLWGTLNFHLPQVGLSQIGGLKFSTFGGRGELGGCSNRVFSTGGWREFLTHLQKIAHPSHWEKKSPL